MLGVLVSLGSAISFSLSSVAVRRGVAKAPVSHGTFVTVLMGVPLFLLAATASGQVLHAGNLSLTSYGLLACAGIVHYVFGRYFNYAGVEAIGAARSGPINALNLPYSIVLAWLFLGEDLSLGIILGIVLALAGPLLMIERRTPARQPVAVPAGSVPAEAQPPAEGEFKMRQLEGYVFAVLCAVGYGTSPVLIRSALEGAHGVSIFGGFIAYSAASGLLLLSLLLPSRRGLLAALNVETMRAFFYAGFFVFLAQMLNFIALTLASVAVVGTLIRFSTMFTLMLSWVYNRRLEMITLRTVLGVALTVAGAVVMVLA